MTIMVAEVFDALRSAGADEEKARAAAIAVAEAQGEPPRASNGADNRALPAPVDSEPGWDPRVDQIESQVDTRVSSLERGFAARLSQAERTFETRFERNEARHGKLDDRLKRVEKRLDADTRGGAWLKWLVALLLLLQAASFYLMWRILLSLPTDSGGLG